MFDKEKWSKYTHMERAIYITILVVAGLGVVASIALIVLAIVESARGASSHKHQDSAGIRAVVPVNLPSGLRVNARRFSPEKSAGTVQLEGCVQADVLNHDPKRAKQSALLYAHALVPAGLLHKLLDTDAVSFETKSTGADRMSDVDSDYPKRLSDGNRSDCRDDHACIGDSDAVAKVVAKARRAMKLDDNAITAETNIVNMDHAATPVLLSCQDYVCKQALRDHDKDEANNRMYKCGCIAHACVFLCDVPAEEDGGNIVVNDEGVFWAFRPQPGDALLWNKGDGSLFSAMPTTQKYQKLCFLHIAFVRQDVQVPTSVRSHGNGDDARHSYAIGHHSRHSSSEVCAI